MLATGHLLGNDPADALAGAVRIGQDDDPPAVLGPANGADHVGADGGTAGLQGVRRHRSLHGGGILLAFDDDNLPDFLHSSSMTSSVDFPGSCLFYQKE